MGLNYRWIAWLGVLFMACGTKVDAVSAYDKLFKDLFGQVIKGDNGVQLSLSQGSGAGFISKETLMYGWFNMSIKFVKGDSAGVVLAFYLTSNSWQHNEIDFEFLGSPRRNPRLHILQTNVFLEGQGGREQTISLWFDPSEKFHAYSIQWTKNQIAMFVDDVLIRVFTNCKGKFSLGQKMKLYGTLWDGSSWASDGGRDGIDWSKGPFLANFTGFSIQSCRRDARFCSFKNLNEHQYSQLSWVHKKQTIYNYCKDKQRYPGGTPPE